MKNNAYKNFCYFSNIIAKHKKIALMNAINNITKDYKAPK